VQQPKGNETNYAVGLVHVCDEKCMQFSSIIECFEFCVLTLFGFVF